MVAADWAGGYTHISDDRIWLAYAASHYIETTGDRGILDETVTFIEAAELKADEHEAYTLPTIADESASFFEHCARALDDSLAIGAHGLQIGRAHV